MNFQYWKTRFRKILAVAIGFAVLSAIIFIGFGSHPQAMVETLYTTSLLPTANATNPVPVASQAKTETVSFNNSEESVRAVQIRLKQLGYYPGAIDGIYGQNTQEAVFNFQQSLGLEINGLIDERTWKQLQPDNDQTQPSLRSQISPDFQRILDRGKLIVALLGTDNSPFFMNDQKGELYGLDIKIAKGLAEQLGVDVEFNRSAKTFNEVADQVYRLEADLAISKLSRTLSRAKTVIFSRSYLKMRQGLLVNRLQLAKAAKGRDVVEVIKDLNGKIGVIKGSSYVGFTKQKFPKATVVEYPTWEEVIVATINGEVLAAYRDELEVKKIILTQPDAALNFQTVALTDTQDPIAIALPWDSSHLLEFVNQYLDTLQFNYTVDSLLQEYSTLFENTK